MRCRSSLGTKVLRVDLKFSISKDVEVRQRFFTKKLLTLVWIGALIGITVKEYFVGTFNEFLVKLLFTFSPTFNEIFCLVNYL